MLLGNYSYMPKSLNASINESLKLVTKSKIKEAISLLKDIVRRYPSKIDPLLFLGELCLKHGECSAAEQHLKQALKLDSKNTMAHFYLGLAYEKNENNKLAFHHYRESLNIDPNQSDVLHSIAKVIMHDGQNMAAYHYFEKAYKMNPNDINLNSDMAFVCHSLGRASESAAFYRKLINLAPQDKHYLSSYIFAGHKDASCTLQDLKNSAELYYERHINNQNETLNIDHSVKLDINKKNFRIGFVSGDFNRHPAGFSLYAVLEKLAKDHQLYLYYNDKRRDDLTEIYENLATKFTNIKEVDSLSAAKLIVQDEIDILFDLSGFTKGERLEIFKHRPAPLQISYLGYFGTLGMKEIDYLIADHCTIQDDEDQFHTEKIYKFENYSYHSSLHAIPEHAIQPPCITNGYVTLGSLNTFHKISNAVLGTWISILRQIPNSRLLFDSRNMISVTDQEYFINLFVNNGIAKERLTFRATVDREKFLQCYDEIDIALDPFPYTGATTTTESLLMGVPIVTLFGNKWSGRFSSSILKTIGHEELVAYSIEEYQNKIIALANDKERLKQYKRILKTDVHSSPMNIDCFMSEFNKALVKMWQSKCA